MQENNTEQKQSQNILEQEEDYNNLYKNWYKKIPKILAIFFAVPFLLFSFVSFVLTFTSGAKWFLFALVSFVIGVLGFATVRFFSAVCLSQKIMVVKELKEINDKLSHNKFDSDKRE